MFANERTVVAKPSVGTKLALPPGYEDLCRYVFVPEKPGDLNAEIGRKLLNKFYGIKDAVLVRDGERMATLEAKTLERPTEHLPEHINMQRIYNTVLKGVLKSHDYLAELALEFNEFARYQELTSVVHGDTNEIVLQGMLTAISVRYSVTLMEAVAILCQYLHSFDDYLDVPLYVSYDALLDIAKKLVYDWENNEALVQTNFNIRIAQQLEWRGLLVGEMRHLVKNKPKRTEAIDNTLQRIFWGAIIQRARTISELKYGLNQYKNTNVMRLERELAQSKRKRRGRSRLTAKQIEKKKLGKQKYESEKAVLEFVRNMPLAHYWMTTKATIDWVQAVDTKRDPNMFLAEIKNSLIAPFVYFSDINEEVILERRDVLSPGAAESIEADISYNETRRVIDQSLRYSRQQGSNELQVALRNSMEFSAKKRERQSQNISVDRWLSRLWHLSAKEPSALNQGLFTRYLVEMIDIRTLKRNLEFAAVHLQVLDPNIEDTIILIRYLLDFYGERVPKEIQDVYKAFFSQSRREVLAMSR